MPTNMPTGKETYIYSHKQHPGCGTDDRQYRGQLHDTLMLPKPECENHVAPLIMIEPSYAKDSTDVFLHFREGGVTMFLSKSVAEQLRDALTKVLS